LIGGRSPEFPDAEMVADEVARRGKEASLLTSTAT